MSRSRPKKQPKQRRRQTNLQRRANQFRQQQLVPPRPVAYYAVSATRKTFPPWPAKPAFQHVSFLKWGPFSILSLFFFIMFVCACVRARVCLCVCCPLAIFLALPEDQFTSKISAFGNRFFCTQRFRDFSCTYELF